MPYSYCTVRISSVCFIVAILFLSAPCVLAAEWRECEAAKLRQLQLQRSDVTEKISRRKSPRRSENRQQRAEEIDTWLWKNCREFSYELRQLEQERM